ncbi:alpha/beta hydrolase [Paenibacillus plantarum]|uniref:alpha/beta hydrolase n=1 Tax=Paenibacillus plantarum TaxID=2654975 RepID=UPI001492A21C|nr:alpha/beta hydrolase-fold protein [Paenibacillus plantarum]
MQGNLDTLEFANRTIYVYTPASYKLDVARRFPSVIVQDGSYLFVDSMTALEADFASGVTEEVIFIGIEPQERNREYTPWRAENLVNDGGFFEGEGDVYLKMVTEEIMPYVRTRYRILKDAAHTGITGASFGGLISLYAAFQKPAYFGRFALMSASLWYANFMDFVEQHVFTQSDMRIFLYVGEQEGVGRTTLQQHMVPNTRKAYELLSQKIPGGRDCIRLETDPEGLHLHSYFNAYFPHAIRFIFPGGR